MDKVLSRAWWSVPPDFRGYCRPVVTPHPSPQRRKGRGQQKARKNRNRNIGGGAGGGQSFPRTCAHRLRRPLCGHRWGDRLLATPTWRGTPSRIPYSSISASPKTGATCTSQNRGSQCMRRTSMFLDAAVSVGVQVGALL